MRKAAVNSTLAELGPAQLSLFHQLIYNIDNKHTLNLILHIDVKGAVYLSLHGSIWAGISLFGEENF